MNKYMMIFDFEGEGIDYNFLDSLDEICKELNDDYGKSCEMIAIDLATREEIARVKYNKREGITNEEIHFHVKDDKIVKVTTICDECESSCDGDHGPCTNKICQFCGESLEGQ